MERLRVALFGSGSPMSVAAFRLLRQTTQLTRVVVPRPRPERGFLRRIVGRERTNPLLNAAAEACVATSFEDGASRDIQRDAVDLICVATFPRLLPPEILDHARVGGLNLHGSLLPRHRGPDPLFWTYFDADRECGITLHWMNSAADGGDIAAQRRWELVPGTRATAVYKRQVDEGMNLLADELQYVARGNRRGTPQDVSLATHEPSPSRRTWSIDFNTWSIDRVWHFLNGLTPVRNDLLTLNGKRLQIFPNLQLTRRTHDRRPGTLVVRNRSFELFCDGGVIEGHVVPPLLTLRRAVVRFLAG
ncbi:MAG TPA: formyltransferase family protein [Thermoanaerobaculia bacterium]|nr:formyltransferase family protein [Thermoanaerobaculia bacterium]